jgi:hypothetical protein
VDGNVGIGTTGPTSALHVYGSATTYVTVDSPASSASALKLSAAGVEKATIYRAATSNDLRFYTAGIGDAMTIMQGGNIGIGTTNPGARLQVSSGNSVYTAANGTVNVYTTTASGQDIGGSIFLGGETGLGTTPWPFGEIAGRAEGASTYAGYLQFVTGSSAGTQNERMRITSTGNVGIGTTTPASLLTIGSGTPTTAANGINFGTDTTANLYRSAAGTIKSDGGLDISTLNVRGTGGSIVLPSSGGIIGAGVASISIGDANDTFNFNGINNFDNNSSSVTANFTNSGSGAIARFYKGATEALTVANSGNVGIGTTGPTAKLHVNGVNGVLSYLQSSGGSAWQQFGSSDGTKLWVVGQGTDDGSVSQFGIRDQGAGITRMLINSTGNVGVGTTAPVARLDIYGADTNTLQINNTAAVSASSGAGISGFTSGLPSAADQRLGFYTLGAKDGGTLRNTVAIQGFSSQAWASGTAGGSYLTFSTTPNNSFTRAEVMRVDQAGNVGIGTTAPTHTLEVSSNNGTDYAAYILNTHNASGSQGLFVGRYGYTGGYALRVQNDVNGDSGGPFDAFVVDGTNRVGIGTATPATALHIQTATGTGSLLSLYQSSVRRWQIGTTANADAFKLTDVDSGTVPFSVEAAAPANSLIVKTSGNVGIGTTTPGGKLGIYSSNITIDGIQLTHNNASAHVWALRSGITSVADESFEIRDNTAGASRLAINTNGNVGIGTTGPTQKLDISGSGQTIASVTDTNNVTRDARIRVATLGSTWDLQGGSTTFNILENSNSNAAYLTIARSTGNVGIGTTGPGTLLDVNGSATIRGTILQNNSDVALSLVGASSARTWTIMSNTSSGSGVFGIRDATAGQFRLAIDTNGNVGIGTTAPQGKFHIGLGSDQSSSKTWTANSSSAQGFLLDSYRVTGDSHRRYADIVSLGDQDSANGGSIIRFLTNPVNSYTAVERMRIDRDGNVGIGTTAPSTLFEVDSTGSVGASIRLNALSTGNSTIQYYRGNAFKFEVGPGGGSNDYLVYNGALGGYSFRIKSDVGGNIILAEGGGNVGIGTTAPGAKLEVNGTIKITAGSGGGINFADGTTITSNAAAGAGIVSNTDVSLSADADANGSGVASFSTGGIERIRISNAGNVGIGTTSPTVKLNIAETSTGFPLLAFTGVGAADTFLGGNGSISQLSINRNPQSGVFTNTSAAAANIGLITASADAYINFYTSAANNTVPTERMRIDKNGNVGIGTTGPLAKLAVASPNTTVPFQLINTSNSNNNWLTVTSQSDNAKLNLYNSAGAQTVLLHTGGDSYITGGNVGIGTTGPSGTSLGLNRILDIGGSTALGFVLHPNGGTGEFAVASGGDGLIVSASGSATASGNNVLRFFTEETNSQFTPTERMRIDAGGNVGIGTTAPNYALTLAGVADPSIALTSINNTNPQGLIRWQLSGQTLKWYIGAHQYLSNDFEIGDASAARLVVQATSGNVGIGTTAPTAPLEVKGTGTGATIAKFTDVNTTGCTLATGGTISCSSDIRLKKNIEDINYGLSTVMQLRPVLYNWNYETDGQTKSLGFIAQEVEALVPKLVATDDQGMKSLNTTGIIPILTKGIQELDLKITDLTDLNDLTKSNTLRDNMVAWFGNVGNGISKLFVGEINTDNIKTKTSTTESLCVKNDRGETCITRDQLDALLSNFNGNMNPPAPAPNPDPAPTPTCTDGIQNQDETGVDTGGVCTPADSGTSPQADSGNSPQAPEPSGNPQP